MQFIVQFTPMRVVSPEVSRYFRSDHYWPDGAGQCICNTETRSGPKVGITLLLAFHDFDHSRRYVTNIGMHV